MKFLLIAFVMALGALSSGDVLAQDSGYSPPPMFEEQQPLPPPSKQPARQAPILTQDGKTRIAPRISPRVDYDPPKSQDEATDTVVKKMAPILERRSSPQIARDTKPVPVPPKKPQAPASATKQDAPDVPVSSAVKSPSIETPKASAPSKPVQALPEVTVKPVVPKAASVVKHDGYVTGPKTMPAIPTQNVDSIAVSGTQEDQGLTILERHQRETKAKKDEAKKVTEEKVAAKKAATEQAATPPDGYEKTAQNALKKILPYEAGAVDLPPSDMKAVADGIVSELAKRSGWRVQIRAYASPNGGGLGSDKRIALGRAMGLRKFLLDQGVAPEKIDLRAEGSATEPGQMPDRVDVYLFGPQKTAEKR